MMSIPYTRRASAQHPPWCDVARCLTVHALGEHRSAPLRLGRVILTLTQRVGDDRPVLHTRTVTPLRPRQGDGGMRHALTVVARISTAIAASRRHDSHGYGVRTEV